MQLTGVVVIGSCVRRTAKIRCLIMCILVAPAFTLRLTGETPVPHLPLVSEPKIDEAVCCWPRGWIKLRTHTSGASQLKLSGGRMQEEDGG